MSQREVRDVNTSKHNDVNLNEKIETRTVWIFVVAAVAFIAGHIVTVIAVTIPVGQ